DRNHALAHVVAGQGYLGGLGQALPLHIVLQRTGQGRAKTGQVRTAVPLRDVVGEAIHGFLIRISPLHRNLNRDRVLLSHQADDVGVQWRLQLGQVLDKGADAAFVGEDFALPFTSLVDEFDGDARIQERQLTQALDQHLVPKLEVVAERFPAWPKAYKRTPAARCALDLQRVKRRAVAVFLQVLEAV